MKLFIYSALILFALSCVSLMYICNVYTPEFAKSGFDQRLGKSSKEPR